MALTGTTRTADVVIVGGGIVGTSIAFHLARMGAGDVVLVERNHLAAGATGLSCGLVRQYADDPLDAMIIAKTIETLQHFDDAVGGDCTWVTTGLLYLVPPAGLDDMQANITMLQMLGLKASLVAPDDIRRLAPYLAIDEPMFGVYDPVAGYADPYATTLGFADGARRCGAQVLQNTKVTGISVDSGRVTAVQTSQGEIAAPTVIDAAGPWGGVVAAMAGVSTDLTPELHQVGYVKVPSGVTWPHLSVIDTLRYTYFRPETGRLTLIGASFANRHIGVDRLDTYSQSLTHDTQFAMLERFCARFPGMETAGVRKGHAGVYINTPDEHALLGPVPGVDGFYLATGLSGQGFKMAAALGQALAELVLNGRAEIADITPLRVTRFEEGHAFK